MNLSTLSPWEQAKCCSIGKCPPLLACDSCDSAPASRNLSPSSRSSVPYVSCSCRGRLLVESFDSYARDFCTSPAVLKCLSELIASATRSHVFTRNPERLGERIGDRLTCTEGPSGDLKTASTGPSNFDLEYVAGTVCAPSPRMNENDPRPMRSAVPATRPRSSSPCRTLEVPITTAEEPLGFSPESRRVRFVCSAAESLPTWNRSSSRPVASSSVLHDNSPRQTPIGQVIHAPRDALKLDVAMSAGPLGFADLASSPDASSVVRKLLPDMDSLRGTARDPGRQLAIGALAHDVVPSSCVVEGTAPPHTQPQDRGSPSSSPLDGILERSDDFVPETVHEEATEEAGWAGPGYFPERCPPPKKPRASNQCTRSFETVGLRTSRQTSHKSRASDISPLAKSSHAADLVALHVNSGGSIPERREGSQLSKSVDQEVELLSRGEVSEEPKRRETCPGPDPSNRVHMPESGAYLESSRSKDSAASSPHTRFRRRAFVEDALALGYDGSTSRVASSVAQDLSLRREQIDALLDQPVLPSRENPQLDATCWGAEQISTAEANCEAREQVCAEHRSVEEGSGGLISEPRRDACGACNNSSNASTVPPNPVLETPNGRSPERRVLLNTASNEGRQDQYFGGGVGNFVHPTQVAPPLDFGDAVDDVRVDDKVPSPCPLTDRELPRDCFQRRVRLGDRKATARLSTCSCGVATREVIPLVQSRTLDKQVSRNKDMMMSIGNQITARPSSDSEMQAQHESRACDQKSLHLAQTTDAMPMTEGIAEAYKMQSRADSSRQVLGDISNLNPTRASKRRRTATTADLEDSLDHCSRSHKRPRSPRDAAGLLPTLETPQGPTSGGLLRTYTQSPELPSECSQPVLTPVRQTPSCVVLPSSEKCNSAGLEEVLSLSEDLPETYASRALESCPRATLQAKEVSEFPGFRSKLPTCTDIRPVRVLDFEEVSRSEDPRDTSSKDGITPTSVDTVLLGRGEPGRVFAHLPRASTPNGTPIHCSSEAPSGFTFKIFKGIALGANQPDSDPSVSYGGRERQAVVTGLRCASTPYYRDSRAASSKVVSVSNGSSCHVARGVPTVVDPRTSAVACRAVVSRSVRDSLPILRALSALTQLSDGEAQLTLEGRLLSSLPDFSTFMFVTGKCVPLQMPSAQPVYTCLKSPFKGHAAATVANIGRMEPPNGVHVSGADASLLVFRGDACSRAAQRISPVGIESVASNISPMKDVLMPIRVAWNPNGNSVSQSPLAESLLGSPEARLGARSSPTAGRSLVPVTFATARGVPIPLAKAFPLAIDAPQGSHDVAVKRVAALPGSPDEGCASPSKEPNYAISDVANPVLKAASAEETTSASGLVHPQPISELRHAPKDSSGQLRKSKGDPPPCAPAHAPPMMFTTGRGVPLPMPKSSPLQGAMSPHRGRDRNPLANVNVYESVASTGRDGAQAVPGAPQLPQAPASRSSPDCTPGVSGRGFMFTSARGIPLRKPKAKPLQLNAPAIATNKSSLILPTEGAPFVFTTGRGVTLPASASSAPCKSARCLEAKTASVSSPSAAPAVSFTTGKGIPLPIPQALPDSADRLDEISMQRVLNPVFSERLGSARPQDSLALPSLRVAETNVPTTRKCQKDVPGTIPAPVFRPNMFTTGKGVPLPIGKDVTLPCGPSGGVSLETPSRKRRLDFEQCGNSEARVLATSGPSLAVGNTARAACGSGEGHLFRQSEGGPYVTPVRVRRLSTPVTPRPLRPIGGTLSSGRKPPGSTPASKRRFSGNGKQFKMPRRVHPTPSKSGASPGVNNVLLPAASIPRILRSGALALPSSRGSESSCSLADFLDRRYRPPSSCLWLYDLVWRNDGLTKCLSFRFSSEMVGSLDILPRALLESRCSSPQVAASIGIGECTTWVSQIFENVGSKGSTRVGSPAWTRMSYALAVWKLARLALRALQSGTPVEKAIKFFTAGHVVRELSRRIRKEWSECYASPLLRMLRRDTSSVAHIVLVVTAVPSGKSDRAQLEVSDGWYIGRAMLDPALSMLVKERKRIDVGDKLHVSHASIVDGNHGSFFFGSGDELEAACLRLSVNGVRKVKRRYTASAKLGFQRGPGLYVSSLQTIMPYGGVVPCVVGLVRRSFPLLYVERRESEPDIVRQEEGEEQAMEAFLERAQRAAETRVHEDGSNDGRPGCDAGNADCPEVSSTRDVTRKLEFVLGSLKGAVATRQEWSMWTVTVWNPTEDVIEYVKREGSPVLLVAAKPELRNGGVPSLRVESSCVCPAGDEWKLQIDPTAVQPRTACRIEELFGGVVREGEAFDGVFVIVHVGPLSGCGCVRHVFLVDAVNNTHVIALELREEDAREVRRVFRSFLRADAGRACRLPRCKPASDVCIIGLRDAKFDRIVESSGVANVVVTSRTEILSRQALGVKHTPGKASRAAASAVARPKTHDRLDYLRVAAAELDRRMQGAGVSAQLELLREAAMALVSGDKTSIRAWYSQTQTQTMTPTE